MKMDYFIRAHVHIYEFFDGVPTRLVYDNLKAGVVSHPKEGKIILSQDYEALGDHYTTAICRPAYVNLSKKLLLKEWSVKL